MTVQRHAVAMMKRLRDVTNDLGKTVVPVLREIYDMDGR